MEGLSLTALAKKAAYDQSAPYRHLEKEDLANHIILRWGKAMNYHFRREFPDLSLEWGIINNMENRRQIEIGGLDECVKKVEY